MEPEPERAKKKKPGKARAIKVSPQQQLQAAPVEAPARAQKKPKRSGSKILPTLGLTLVAAVAAVGVFIGAASHLSPSTDPAPSEAKKQELSQNQQSLRAHGLKGNSLSPGQVQALTLSPALAAMLGLDMRAHEIQVFDSQAEDGDRVLVSANGYQQEVLLTHSPTSVVLPYSLVGSNQVTITGVHDGGGGVTLGVVSSGSRVPLLPIQPGGKVVLPFK